MLFIISWFLAGFISMLCIWIHDMRDEEFDKYYFDVGNVCLSLLALLGGYISAIICYNIWATNNRPFTKLIYKLVNIGIKKE